MKTTTRNINWNFKKILQNLTGFQEHFNIWKLLFEFTVVLLAVLVGFIFNDMREEKQEANKTKEFAIELYKDLKAESKLIGEKIEFRHLKDTYADSLFLLLQNYDTTKDGGAIYFYHRSTSRRGFISSSNATIEQLKYTGEMKLFKSTKIISEIFSYDINRRDIEQLQQVEEEILYDLRRLAPKILDAKILEEIVPDIEVKRLRKSAKIISHDPKVINEISVNLHYANSANRRLVTYLVNLKTQCDNLSRLIRKEFKITQSEIDSF